MTKEKKTKFVILGFLMSDSLSGYEIGALIKNSTNYFWQESDASIYPTLKLLSRDGLVSSKTEFVGKRRKEIFTITSDGKKAFFDWFKKTPDQDLHREEFLLKLFFTSDTTKKQMALHCEQRLQELQDTHRTYKEIEEYLQRDRGDKAYWLKTLQLGIAHLELDMEWLIQHQGEHHAANSK